ALGAAGADARAGRARRGHLASGIARSGPGPEPAACMVMAAPTRRRQKWVRTVTTDSTHPPAGLFTKDAATIARTLASTKVSPKGPSSGMRMLTYFINRGGRGLSKTRRAELERAKRLLSARVQRARERRNASATGG